MFVKLFNSIIGRWLIGIILTVTIVALVIIGNTMVGETFYYFSSVTEESIIVENAIMNPCDQYQRKASILITVCNNQVYYYFSDLREIIEKYEDKIVYIEDGQIVTVCSADDILGGVNDHIYYRKGNYLCVYNTKTKKSSKVTKLTFGNYDYEFDSNGALKLVPNKTNNTMLYIEDGIVQKEIQDFEPLHSFQIGEKTYCLYDSNELFCNNQDISDSIGTAENGGRALIPLRDGLLLKNSGFKELVYYISPDGSIEALFPKIDCGWTNSSLTAYGNYVFLSFERIEGWDESGVQVKRYENDTISGTYRIDIRDKSYVKISDTYYHGIYVYDETGIFCTTYSGLVQKLDFDGNVVTTILTP